LKIQTNCVFNHLENSNKRITVEQGGARSGKTYNILIWLIIKLTQVRGKVLTITRGTRPAVKATVFRDFLEILGVLGLYNKDNLNKTDLEYTLCGNIIEFIGMDQEQKVRGRKRNYLFCNEFNELTYDQYYQLAFRTTEKIILDYNPSDDQHFVFKDIITRDDCEHFITTYKDNPFLEDSIIHELERLKNKDPYLWKVFGLGEKGIRQNIVFPRYQVLEDDLFGLQSGTEIRGMDFGFNDPAVMIKIKVDDDRKQIFIKEEVYKTHLSVSELIKEMKLVINNKQESGVEIIADCSRPDTIEELYQAGFNIHPCEKGPNSVYEGITDLKQYDLFITKSSLNIKKEMDNYKWKEDKNGKVLDQPVDAFNHAMDSLRYAKRRKNNNLYFTVI
jgi:phage terminase large subunit